MKVTSGATVTYCEWWLKPDLRLSSPAADKSSSGGTSEAGWVLEVGLLLVIRSWIAQVFGRERGTVGSDPKDEVSRNQKDELKFDQQGNKVRIEIGEIVYIVWKLVNNLWFFSPAIPLGWEVFYQQIWFSAFNEQLRQQSSSPKSWRLY